jgi:hypothetical protein
MRGRTALYGRSHLAQLVAIKRLQAGGLTVAAVQERLLGADESAIEEIAMLPDDLDDLVAAVDADSEAASTGSKSQPAQTAQTAQPAQPAQPAPRSRFWATPAATLLPEEAPARTTTTPPADAAPLVPGIRLAAEVTLLLPPGRVPDAAARAAITEAARPLLDLLERLGLSEA